MQRGGAHHAWLDKTVKQWTRDLKAWKATEWTVQRRKTALSSIEWGEAWERNEDDGNEWLSDTDESLHHHCEHLVKNQFLEKLLSLGRGLFVEVKNWSYFFGLRKGIKTWSPMELCQQQVEARVTCSCSACFFPGNPGLWGLPQHLGCLPKEFYELPCGYSTYVK